MPLVHGLPLTDADYTHSVTLLKKRVWPEAQTI